MQTIVEVEHALNVYSISKVFVGKSEDGRHWAIKGWREAQPETRLHMVREFIAGNLACWMGLPWPSPPEWVNLPPHLISPAEKWRIESGVCVATEFLPDLSELLYDLEDPVYDTSNDRFMRISEEQRLRIVKDTLLPFLASPANLAVVYGRVVFDNWLGENDPMMDTLQVRGDGSLVCLDGSTALHSRQVAQSTHRQQRHNCIHQAYLGWNLCARSVLTERLGFDPWLRRLLEFRTSTWESLVREVPGELANEVSEVAILKSEICNTQAFVDEFVTRPPYTLLA